MKMNHRAFTAPLAAALALTLLAGALQAQSMTAYWPRPGSKVKIDGDSTIHKWTVEGSIIGGKMELDSKLQITANPAAFPVGKVNAKVDASIPVTSLKSGKDLMDNIMYDAMKQTNFARILYSLKELTLKEAPKAGSPLEFDSVGDLTVSGVKKTINMPVKMEPMEGDKVKVTGSVKVKMTDFGIQPPSPKISGGLIKTDDDVTVSIEWVTFRRAEAAAK